MTGGGDTTREARRTQLEVYRRMDGASRVALAYEMSDDMRTIAEAGTRARSNPVSSAEFRPSTTQPLPR